MYLKAKFLTASLFVIKAASSAPTTPSPTTSPTPYEVWASDQSNTAPDQGKLGVKGGYIWIWSSEQIQKQLEGYGPAEPSSCTSTAPQGPCDTLEVFPQNLVQYFQDGTQGSPLKDLSGFGRIHGMIRDPQGLYVTVNMFTPGGGYVGIIDTQTREAVGLFRVTKFKYGPNDTINRSVHMSVWATDGSFISVSNLHGKAVERINIERDTNGKITQLSFDKSATIGLGKNMQVIEEATVFKGYNAYGNQLMGEVIGDYANADLGDLTPNGKCKENGCTSGIDGEAGGRANNLPICAITSKAGLIYITLAGGGLLIANAGMTPMSIVGEYGKNIIYGAGCGGVQVGDSYFFDSGVSASSAGADQSYFAIWRFNDTLYEQVQPENDPLPEVIFEDPGNGIPVPLNAIGGGQIPGSTIRRDSHGMINSIQNNHIHTVDRIQNVVESIRIQDNERITYDLISETGRDGFGGSQAACANNSVPDFAGYNDPSPDLMDITPDGKYIMISFRGPTPVSVSHSGQGSCPGVGIVKLSEDGSRGRLIDVIRTTNMIPDNVSRPLSFTGGFEYSGDERSDVHGAIVVPKGVNPSTAPPTATARGDPHFQTWSGEKYDFHGVCDLVLLTSREINIHIRTKKMQMWSYIKAVSVQINDDILEVMGGNTKKEGNNFWVNKEPGKFSTNIQLSKYAVKFTQLNDKSQQFVIDMGSSKGTITIKTWNAMVSISLTHGSLFQQSRGLMGTYPDGRKVSRSSDTVIMEDYNLFGIEWQVQSFEPLLFHDAPSSNVLESCEIPSKSQLRRRLSQAKILKEDAELACARVNKEDFDLCVFDVMATNDRQAAGAY